MYMISYLNLCTCYVRQIMYRVLYLKEIIIFILYGVIDYKVKNFVVKHKSNPSSSNSSQLTLYKQNKFLYFIAY